VKVSYTNSGAIVEEDIKMALNTTKEPLQPNSQLIMQITLYYKSDAGNVGNQVYKLRIPVEQADASEDFGDDIW